LVTAQCEEVFRQVETHFSGYLFLLHDFMALPENRCSNKNVKKSTVNQQQMGWGEPESLTPFQITLASSCHFGHESVILKPTFWN